MILVLIFLIIAIFNPVLAVSLVAVVFIGNWIHALYLTYQVRKSILDMNQPIKTVPLTISGKNADLDQSLLEYQEAKLHAELKSFADREKLGFHVLSERNYYAGLVKDEKDKLLGLVNQFSTAYPTILPRLTKSEELYEEQCEQQLSESTEKTQCFATDAHPIEVSDEGENLSLDEGKLKEKRAAGAGKDTLLWDALRAKRRELADEQDVPPFVIFHDATLMAMIEEKPTDLKQMSYISGVGEKKLELYGDKFLEVLQNFSEIDLPDTAVESLK